MDSSLIPALIRSSRAIAATILLLLIGGGAAGAQPLTQCVSNAQAGGTSDALTVPLLPCGLATNILLLTLSNANTTTAPTLQMVGYPALPILSATGGNIGVADLPAAGSVVMLTGTGQSWLLLSNGPNTANCLAAQSCPFVVFYNKNQSFSAAQRATPVSLVLSGPTATPNFDTGQNFKLGLVHASCPCTLANPSTMPVAGQTGTLEVDQSATGGDVLTWGSSYVASGGVATLLLSSASGAKDYFSYLVVDSTHVLVTQGILNATH